MNDKPENHPILKAVGELNAIRAAADGTVHVPIALTRTLVEAAMLGYLHDGTLQSFSRLKIDLDLQFGAHVHIDVPHAMSPEQVAFLRDNLEHLFGVAMANHDKIEARRVAAESAGP